MKKKLLSLVAVIALFAPCLSFAVGLGSVRTYSSLNERLNAEIPVLSVRKKGKISVSLASNAMFAEKGITRSEILNSLRFSVVEKRGRTYIRVSSVKNISSPYLNFILQLKSPEGNVAREYAIFLDPANSTTKRQVTRTVANSRSSQAKKSISERGSRQKQQSQSIAIASRNGGKYGPVRRGETLWSIAKYTRPSENIAVRDMVTAIKRANPKTLANGLPAGVMLNIPTIQGYSSFKGGYAQIPTKVVKKIKKTPQNKPVKPSAVSANAKIVTDLHRKKTAQRQELSDNNTTHLTESTDKVIAEVNPKVNPKESQLSAVAPNKADTVKDSVNKVVTDANNQLAAELPPKVEEEPSVAIKPVVNIDEKPIVPTVTEQPAVTDSPQIPAVKPVTKPVVKANSTPKTAPKPKPKMITKPQIVPVAEPESGLPIIPILAGVGTLLVGALAFIFVGKRRKKKNADNPVVLLDDDEDFADIDDEAVELLDTDDDTSDAVNHLEDLSTLADSEQSGDIETSDTSLDELADDFLATSDDSGIDDDLLSDFDDIDFGNDDNELVGDSTDNLDTDDALSFDVPDSETNVADDTDDMALDDLDFDWNDDIETVSDNSSDEVFESLSENHSIDSDENGSADELELTLDNEGDDALSFDFDSDDESGTFDLSDFDDDLSMDDTGDDLLSSFDEEIIETDHLNVATLDDKADTFDSADDNDSFDFSELDEIDNSSIDLSDLDELATDDSETSSLSFNLDETEEDSLDFAEKEVAPIDTEDTLVDISEINLDDDLLVDDGLLSDELSMTEDDFSAIQDSAAEMPANQIDEDLDLFADIGTAKVTGAVASAAAVGLSSSSAAEAVDATESLSATDDSVGFSESVVSSSQMKLDLASSFMSISNNTRAKQLLNQVISEGSKEQVEKATQLLEEIA